MISIFGKSWDLHTKRALGITEEENLAIISDTVAFIKAAGRELVYDAEHFFDGYTSNPDFALRTLDAAKKAGADVLVLCDTNGGTLPHRVAEVIDVVRARFDGIIGIHAHNDSDVAVANTLVAVDHGVMHVQGTINGYGERCGNANLISVIASLELKMGHEAIGPAAIGPISDVARYVSERANLPLRTDQPFVGKSAFAHKGGIHVSAVLKHAATYETSLRSSVGNRQRVLLSDLSGRSNVQFKLEHYNLAEGLDEAARKRLLARIKELEHEGYDFEVAEGNFELLVLPERFPDRRFFSLVGFDVSTKAYGGDSEAVASIIVNDQGHLERPRERAGPFDALHNALRRCIAGHYPRFDRVRLPRLQGASARRQQGNGREGPRPGRVGWTESGTGRRWASRMTLSRPARTRCWTRSAWNCFVRRRPASRSKLRSRAAPPTTTCKRPTGGALRDSFGSAVPPLDRIVLVESGAREIFEKFLPSMYGYCPRIDLVTCFGGPPGNFDAVRRAASTTSPITGAAKGATACIPSCGNSLLRGGVICAGSAHHDEVEVGHRGAASRQALHRE